MRMVLCLMILLISIIGVTSCTTTEIKEGEKNHYKTVYKENPFYIEDSTLFVFRDSFNIDKYTYSGSNLYSEMALWVDSLPQGIRDSLFDQKLLLQKKYYLENIQLNNEEKIKKIELFDLKLEKNISARIGTNINIPKTIFTTEIKNIPKGQEEYLIIKLNRLMY